MKLNKFIPFIKGKSLNKSYSVQEIKSGSFLDSVFFNASITSYGAAEFYRESSAVAIAVDTIATAIEGIDPVVELNDGSLDDKNEILDLINNPNEFEDYREFIGQLSRNYLLNSDAFIYAEGGINRPPINLFVVKNQNISLTTNSIDGYPQVFHITNGFGNGVYNREKRNGEIKFYDGALKELYQIHGYSSRSDNGFADSPLEAIATETRQQIKGRGHNLKIIENGGRLSMSIIAKSDPPMSRDDFDEFKTNIQRQFAGSNNAGKIAVFHASDMDIVEHGKTPKDMDFKEIDNIANNAIYMRYGIPLPLVASDRQTFNNFETAIEDFYDRCVLPHANILFSGLTKLLKRRYGDSFKRITYNEDDITALKTRMLKELKLRREIGIETINELREGLPNREDIDGGDILYQPANLVPAGFDDSLDSFENVNIDEAINGG